jgi:hypothetical protein
MRLKKASFTIVTLLYANIVLGQKSHSLEVGVFDQFDKHADYTTRYGNRSYTDDLELWGKSFGFNFNYKRSLNKYFNAKIGLGYYQLGIDKIRYPTRFNTIGRNRNIEYDHPLGIQLLFSTGKYHYDNINLSAGFFYQSRFENKENIIIGADFNYLYSFSQLYHINYDNIKFRTTNSRELGYSINTYFGFEKKFKSSKYYLTPKILIPIYQNLHGDKVFGESSDITMEKWFRGIGLSFSVGKYF